MATLTIKNVPDDLYEKLKKTAAQRRRSMNSEAIVRLEQALGARRVDPDQFLAEVRAMQERDPLPPLTDDMLRKAQSEGRP